MSFHKFLPLFLVVLFFSCTPKVTEEVIEEPVKEVTPTPDPNNPCITFADLDAGKRDEAETAYVLYKDLYDTEEFDKALPLWKKAYGLACFKAKICRYDNDAL